MTSRDGVRSIAVNAAYMGASRGIMLASKILYAIVAARMLGPQAYGLVSYALAWYLAFLPLTTLGVAMILGREIGQDRKNAAVVVPHTLAIRATALVLAMILCGAVALAVETDTHVRTLALIAAAALLGRGLTIWSEHVFVAFEATRFKLVQDGIYRPLEVAFGITVLLQGGGAVGVVAVHAVSWLAQGTHGLWTVRRRFAPLVAAIDWRRIGAMLRSGIVIGIGVAAAGWMISGPLVLFRRFETPPGTLGQVALALQLFSVVSIVPHSISAVALPVLRRSVVRGDAKDTVYVEAMSRMVTLVGLLGALAGFVLGPWAVTLLFGAAYQPAGPLLGWVALLLIPYTASQAMVQLLAARGRYMTIMGSALTGAATLSALAPVLIPAMGPPGVLLAAGVALAVHALIGVTVLAPAAGIALSRAIVYPWTVAALSVAAYFLASRFGPVPAVAAALVTMVAGTLAFGIVRREEWTAILGLARARLGRPVPSQTPDP